MATKKKEAEYCIIITNINAQGLWIEVVQVEQPLPLRKRIGEKGGVR